MLTISVTFGVNFAKNGILMALRIHRQMFRTNSGSCKNNKFDYFSTCKRQEKKGEMSRQITKYYVWDKNAIADEKTKQPLQIYGR